MNVEQASRGAQAPSHDEARDTVAGTTPRRPRIVHQSAGAVVIKDGRCLVLRQAKNWVLPKGHLEERESPADAAIREVREETGLEIVIDGYAGSTRYDFRSAGGLQNTKRVEWYAAHPVGGRLQPEPKFAEAVFLDAAAALERLTYEADREVVDAAYRVVRPVE